MSNGDQKKQHTIKGSPDRQATLALAKETEFFSPDFPESQLGKMLDLLKKRGLSERELQAYLIEVAGLKEGDGPGKDIKNFQTPAVELPPLPPSEAPNTQPEGAPVQLAQNPPDTLGAGVEQDQTEQVGSALRQLAQENFGKPLGELNREEFLTILETMTGGGQGGQSPTPAV